MYCNQGLKNLICSDVIINKIFVLLLQKPILHFEIQLGRTVTIPRNDQSPEFTEN